MILQDSANKILENYAKVLEKEAYASADDREEAAYTLIEVIGETDKNHISLSFLFFSEPF